MWSPVARFILITRLLDTPNNSSLRSPWNLTTKSVTPYSGSDCQARIKFILASSRFKSFTLAWDSRIFCRSFDLIFFEKRGATYSSGLMSTEAGLMAGAAAGACIERNALIELTSISKLESANVLPLAASLQAANQLAYCASELNRRYMSDMPSALGTSTFTSYLPAARFTTGVTSQPFRGTEKRSSEPALAASA